IAPLSPNSFPHRFTLEIPLDPNKSHPSNPPAWQPDPEKAARAFTWQRGQLAFESPTPIRMSLLDRYVLRSFLEPFFMCFAGFVSIWLIIDVADNFNDFLDAHASFSQIFGYYVTQVPQTIIMSLPVGLMLALLFSLSRMSRTNELISQLTAGRSVVR